MMSPQGGQSDSPAAAAWAQAPGHLTLHAGRRGAAKLIHLGAAKVIRRLGPAAPQPRIPQGIGGPLRPATE